MAVADRIVYSKKFEFGMTRLKYSLAANKVFIFGIGFARGVKFLEIKRDAEPLSTEAGLSQEKSNSLS